MNYKGLGKVTSYRLCIILTITFDNTDNILSYETIHSSNPYWKFIRVILRPMKTYTKGGKTRLLKMLKSKKAISPILATLLLIVIAVATVVITYAWVLTFTSSQTQQAGAIPQIENIRFYGSPTAGAKNRTDIVLRNTGTSDAKIVSVYWSSSSLASLSKLTSGTEYSLDPGTGIITSLSSAKVTINWRDTYTTGAEWVSGKTYFFKVVCESGQYVEFPSKAP